MRPWLLACSYLLIAVGPASAEVVNVTIESRTVVADGKSFGDTGAYEQLTGRIEFALDPAAPHNARIVDLEYAQRGADGRVHVSSSVQVLRPTDSAKSNGVLLFEAPNRGNRISARFNRVAGGAGPADFGDGLLLRDGYTVVALGWELGLEAPSLGAGAPRVLLPSDVVDVDGNDVAGIHDPEVAVPLATFTAWNFRRRSVGNPRDIFQLLGSYIPLPRTRAEREAGSDPRLSIEERYENVDAYLERVRAAATELIRDRYMLEEDLEPVLARARAHWDYAMADRPSLADRR